MTKEYQFEFNRLRSMQDEEERTQKIKRMRAVGPSGHAPTTEVTTRQVDYGKTQSDTSI